MPFALTLTSQQVKRETKGKGRKREKSLINRKEWTVTTHTVTITVVPMTTAART